VIHPDWRTDLRASRFVVIAICCDSPVASALATGAGFRKRCNLLQNRGFGRSSAWANPRPNDA
jgi:hypothetical protein